MPRLITGRIFELTVLPRGEDGYGLAVHQVQGTGEGDEEPKTLIVQVWGGPLRSVIEMVLATIRRAGYRPSDLGRSRQAPFRLSEEDGVRLGLLFLAVKPLRKSVRIDAVAERLRAMEPEEAYYWFSKSTAVTGASHALRALRIMVAGD